MKKKITFFMLVWLMVVCSKALGETPNVWVVPSTLHRVGPTDEPGRGTTAVLHAARGEYVSFQVAIHARAGGLTDINFSVSDLVGPDGEIIPSTNLILYREWYISVKKHSPTYNGRPNLPITNVHTFPDALIPFIDPATGLTPIKGRDTHVAVPFHLSTGHNGVIWVDILVPRGTSAGDYRGTYTVSSDEREMQGDSDGRAVKGQIELHVWNFTLPLKPSLKSTFTGSGTIVPGLEEEVLRNKLLPDTEDPNDVSRFIRKYGLNATDLQFFSNVSFGQCVATAPPSLHDVEAAKAAVNPNLYLFDDTADPESGCTDQGFYNSMIAWAQVLHKAGVKNLVTQEPVAQLYNDGLGTGRSAVDIWTMLPIAYDDAQSHTPPGVTFVLKKGDAAWSYNALVQDNYSPKWELDFLPINYRIQPGFINQSLGLTGLLYWNVDDWSTDPWTNPQGAQSPDYPGEGVLVYPGGPAGLQGVAPSMRLKYLRDGVQDYEYIQLLKNCGQATFALSEARKVGPDWTNWTRDESLLEAVREKLGNQIAASDCAP